MKEKPLNTKSVQECSVHSLSDIFCFLDETPNTVVAAVVYWNLAFCNITVLSIDTNVSWFCYLWIYLFSLFISGMEQKKMSCLNSLQLNIKISIILRHHAQKLCPTVIQCNNAIMLNSSFPIYNC